MSRFFVRPSSPSLPLIRGYLAPAILLGAPAAHTNHQLLITSSLCDNLCILWEKSGFIVIRYPLSVTSGCFAPEVKSWMAGEGSPFWASVLSFLLFTNHQLLITSSLCDNLCLLWEKSGFIVNRYPLPVIRDQCVLCTGSQKPDGRMRGAPSGHPYSHSSSSPITNY